MVRKITKLNTLIRISYQTLQENDEVANSNRDKAGNTGIIKNRVNSGNISNRGNIS